MIQQDIFFRRYGARIASQLLKPIVTPIDRFEFPKNSTWHYNQVDGISVGPDPNDYFFRNLDNKIFVEHVIDLNAADNLGTPRKLGIPLMPEVRNFHMRFKRFRITQNVAEAPTQENILSIVSYCLIAKAYKYPRSIYAEYYKWHNAEGTVWKKMAEVAAASNRTQYYFMNLPQTLPSLQRLNTGCKTFSQVTLNIFNTKELLFLLEIWKWISLEYRSTSIIGDISQEALNKINLVIQDNGSWMMFNMGLLNRWRYIKGMTSESEKTKIDPIQMQKLFLRALMSLMSYRHSEVQEQEQQETTQTGSSNPSSADSTDYDKLKVVDENDEDNASEHYQKLLDNLDSDLEQLDIIEKEADKLIRADTIEDKDKISENKKEATTRQKAETEKQKESTAKKKLLKDTGDIAPDSDVVVSKFENKTDVTQAVKTKIDTLADDGMLDGSEYRRKLKLIEKYEALPSPDPSVKLVDYIKIDPAVLKISEEDHNDQIPDIVTVPDKSMLKSSLLDFDRRYIKDVMQKDIVSMAVSTQKAGFVVTDYNVEKIESAIGKYDSHTMRINPVEGLPSTIRFKVPVVEENGTFSSGNTTYYCRKQRAD